MMSRSFERENKNFLWMQDCHITTIVAMKSNETNTYKEQRFGVISAIAEIQQIISSILELVEEQATKEEIVLEMVKRALEEKG